MASITDEIHEKTAGKVNEANETLITVATSLYNKLHKLPLHTHVGVMKILDSMTEHRHQTMQLEAMEQQKATQEAFEAQRKADHEAMKARQADAAEQAAKPQLVT